MKLYYGIHDKPKFPQLIIYAFQQLLAIMAATIAVPAIVGNGMTASAALFGAGAGTIIYQLFTKFNSPVFLGSSFAFIGSMVAAFAGAVSVQAGYLGLVLGAIFLKEKCTVVQVIWTLLSVVGVALTTSGGMGRFSPFGFICLLIAVFSAAMYTIISRDISKSFSPFERTYVMFLMGASVFTVMAGFENRSDLSALVRPLGEPIFWAALIYLAVLSSVCAFMLLNYSVNHIEAGHSLIFANFNTVISVLAGIFIMGEQFMPLQLVGIVMIVFSVFGVSAAKKRVM